MGARSPISHVCFVLVLAVRLVLSSHSRRASMALLGDAVVVFVLFVSSKKNAGAGEGNRTLVVSLEGFCSTIELHPPDETNFRIRARPFALEVAVVEEVGFEPT